MVRRLGAFVSAAFAAVLVVGLASPASAESGWWVPTNPQAVDSEVNITGEPHRGTNSEGEVVGFIDAHTHMFMDLGMGGNAVCGSTYSTKGIADALQDCKNHGTSLLENITNTSGKGIDWLADFQGLATPRFAHPPADVLQVGRTRMARWTAHHGQRHGLESSLVPNHWHRRRTE
jgi:hypothetical protein